jgi:hypothetical protein
MRKLDILVIAPEHPDLTHVVAEVAAYKRNHNVIALSGVVRDLDIANAVEEGPYDVIVFASHGEEIGIRLSDSILSLEAAQQYVKRSGATLAVINTCSSESIGYQLLGEGCDVIFTICAVSDVEAVRFGVLLASALVRYEDYREAFEASIGSGTKYRFLSSSSSSAERSVGRRDDDELRTMVFQMQTEIAVLRTLLVVMLLGMAVTIGFQFALWLRVNALI